nr:hypothetical protein [Campylobacter coli]
MENFINQEFQIGASSNQTVKASIGATQSSKIGLTRFETGSRISVSGEVQFTLKNYNGIDDFKFQKSGYFNLSWNRTWSFS